jgi:hypothetical protein
MPRPRQNRFRVFFVEQHKGQVVQPVVAPRPAETVDAVMRSIESAAFLFLLLLFIVDAAILVVDVDDNIIVWWDGRQR